MGFMEWAEAKTRNLTVWDVALVKWSCIAGGVLLSRLVPGLRRVDTRVLAAITIAFAVKPVVTALRWNRALRRSPASAAQRAAARTGR